MQICYKESLLVNDTFYPTFYLPHSFLEKLFLDLGNHMAALSQILSHPWITDHATTAMVKSMFSERMDMKMEWPRQTKTET